VGVVRKKLVSGVKAFGARNRLICFAKVFVLYCDYSKFEMRLLSHFILIINFLNEIGFSFRFLLAIDFYAAGGGFRHQEFIHFGSFPV
jgi:hypothetical protein